MLSEKIEQALNAQVNAEWASAYLYQAMHAWLLERNLDGFAAWMQSQVFEEMSHGMKIYNFIAERGGRVRLDAIECPVGDWASPKALFEAVLAHERKVTSLINGLVDLAIEERDHATNQFLQWFVEEQVEEESTADGILQKLILAGEGNGIIMMDKDLSARMFRIPPSLGLQVQVGP